MKPVSSPISLALTAWLLLFFMGAMAPFTERTTTDFDTFLQILNPYGVWKQGESQQWQYFPFSDGSYRPMTSGLWIYTDFGWYWQGTEPFSWACDHYGVWKLGKDGVWGWAPDPLWQPFKVDFRETKTHIGWRCSAINQFGEFVEKEEKQRFARPEEWVFVIREKFGRPITPADVLTGKEAAKLLEDSSPCGHTFTSWRQMERLGPDPINFVRKDQIRSSADLKPNEPQIITPTLWSLPTFWTPPPVAAVPGDLYIYRPRCAQDADGIQRRILIWNHPGERERAQENVKKILNPDTVPTGPTPGADPTPPATPPTPPPPAPAVPVAPGSQPWKSKT